MWQQPSIRRCTSGGRASTVLLTTSCCWDPSKDQWLVCISLSGEVSVAPPGSVRKRLWYPMWSSFPDISPAAVRHALIVVPVFNREGTVIAVLDIDSEKLATFDDVDRQYLEQICQLIK